MFSYYKETCTTWNAILVVLGAALSTIIILFDPGFRYFTPISFDAVGPAMYRVAECGQKK
jgi:hypothetical protein